MKSAVFFGLICFFGAMNWAYSRQVLDVTKTRVTLPESPSRIVTLAPSLGELVTDILGSRSERLVGVSEYTDFPPRLKQVTSVGPYSHLNLERIISLKPDLVLGTLDGNSKDQILRLRELGIPVVLVKTENIEDIFLSIRLVSEAAGYPEIGSSLVKRLYSGIRSFRERGRHRPKKRVMMQLSENPLIVVGQKSFLHEMLEVVGAKNVYGETGASYPRPSLEDVITRAPDMILVLALGENTELFQGMAKRWYQFANLKAAREKQVFVLKSDPLLRPTLRILEGLSELEKMIYGKN